MSFISATLNALLRLPEDQIFSAGEDLSPYYRNWGFTVYRTAYNPSLDQVWQALIEKIHAQVADGVNAYCGEEGDQPRRHLISLFRLDPRSDLDLLKDADMDRVRHIYRESAGGAPMHGEEQTCFRLFPLADEEVLTGVPKSQFQIKCVQADYKAADYVPRNTPMGGQRYFGWMKMTTRGLLDFWSLLRVRNLESIAPPTIGGMQLTVWDRD